MADPVYTYLVPTGTIVPDTADIQDQVITEYKNAFGNDLITAPNTPQGLLIVAEVLARVAVAMNNAALANQINPNLAGGIFLDAILALTGGSRTPATHTIVSCNLTGIAGTVIPQGSQARDSVDGSIFESMQAVTLAVDGTATVNFQAVLPGATTVAINTLNQVVSNVLGWETVTNPAVQSSLGSSTQSDVAARLLRKSTLALQGMALPEAIISALYATAGVKSVGFRENIAPTTQVIDGVTMIGHSIYACVDGGTDEEVATILLNKKSGGCAYNNGASGDPVDYVITVPESGQVMTIKFDRPDLIAVICQVTVKADTSIQDPVTTVKNSILAYVNGLLDGEPGFTIGTPVSCFELAGAINVETPGIFVHDLKISLASPVSYGYAEIPIAIFEKATMTASGISVILV
jgi:hypothetical protein